MRSFGQHCLEVKCLTQISPFSVFQSGLGGLGVRDPVCQVGQSFQTSRRATAEIVAVMKGAKDFSVRSHLDQAIQARTTWIKE